jgi:hypothetical protein
MNLNHTNINLFLIQVKSFTDSDVRCQKLANKDRIASDLLYFGINYFERGQYSISFGARIVQPFLNNAILNVGI